MLKGAEIIDGLCEKKTFISDDVKLRYVATLLPGVFSEGTKYACNEEKSMNKKEGVSCIYDSASLNNLR